jgi:hypothetical protein
MKNKMTDDEEEEEEKEERRRRGKRGMGMRWRRILLREVTMLWIVED